MKKKHIIIALIFTMMPLLAGAQALKGSYFLENSVNGHRLNPAFAPRANFLQLPVVGNVGVGMYSNLDVKTFMYPLSSGQLGTFLHPEVSVKQFDKSLPAHPHFDVDFNTNLLSFGFYTKKKAFWTFGVDTRVTLDCDLPRDLFTFMKQGTGAQGGSYNIGNVNAYMMAGVQASLGYSREFAKGLRVGLKVRAIAPLAYGALNLENVRLNTSPEHWSIATEGYLQTSMHGLEYTAPTPEAMMPTFNFNLNQMLANKVLAGLGYSVDLGVRYTLEAGCFMDGLTVSAAITDLGQIFYNADATKSYQSHGNVHWDGITMDENLSFDQGSMNEIMDDMMNQMKNLVNFQESGVPGEGFVKSTMPSVYAGVEMPFLKRSMSVGLLYSARFSHSYVRNELTVSYNLKPAKWFAIGANYSFLNTGGTVGGILELTPKAGPSIYIGCDYFPYEYAPFEYDIDPINIAGYVIETLPVPMSWRLNLNFGLAFNLGSKHANPKK